MQLLESLTGLPKGWAVEESRDWHALVRYRTPEGSIDLACYELAQGVVLTDIDLACSTLPAFNPMGPHVVTINWCASGRCEVDFGERGSLVVGKGALCVSSALAATFTYPTGHYRGFELFIDVDKATGTVWEALGALGVSGRSLGEALFSEGLGTSLVPHGDVADAVRILERELLQDHPRYRWLTLRVVELLVAIVECDLGSAEVSGSYLQRSQRDLAQAVYQHLVANFSPSASLGVLTERLGVSEASLRSYFERVYGQSPAAFARARALGEAARLLAESNRSVADVAQACGYANPSKFSAAFRRTYDVNPLEYRRRAMLG